MKQITLVSGYGEDFISKSQFAINDGWLPIGEPHHIESMTKINKLSVTGSEAMQPIPYFYQQFYKNEL